MATHQLSFREKIDAFESEDEKEMDFFLSLCNYTVEKGQRLRAIIKTIPQKATYTSPGMQNELIAAMSSVVTAGIKQIIGNSWCTIKVEGTKGPTGVESISIIIGLLDEL